MEGIPFSYKAKFFFIDNFYFAFPFYLLMLPISDLKVQFYYLKHGSESERQKQIKSHISQPVVWIPTASLELLWVSWLLLWLWFSLPVLSLEVDLLVDL